MSVLGRVLISSAERLDLADFLSVDSFAQGDFKYLLKGLVGDSTPYVLKGFSPYGAFVPGSSSADLGSRWSRFTR